jgi:hypothetical protein
MEKQVIEVGSCPTNVHTQPQRRWRASLCQGLHARPMVPQPLKSALVKSNRFKYHERCQIAHFRQNRKELSPNPTMAPSGPTLPKNQRGKAQYKRLADTAHISLQGHFTS